MYDTRLAPVHTIARPRGVPRRLWRNAYNCFLGEAIAILYVLLLWTAVARVAGNRE